MYYVTETNGQLYNMIVNNKNLVRNQLHNNKEYYIIPGFPRYSISRDGTIINTLTGKERLLQSGTHRYTMFTMRNEESGQFTFALHRVIASCFLDNPFDKYPDATLESLQVNHINGNRDDNSIDNLEWCTASENVIHALNNGLNKHLPKPVEIRDYETGKISVFQTIRDAASYMKVSKDTVTTRSNSNGAKIYNDGHQWRWFTGDGKPWPEANVNRIYGDPKRPIILYDLVRNTEHEFPSAADLARILKVSTGTVSAYVNDPSQPNFNKFYLIQWKDEMKPWREVKDYYYDYAKSTEGNIVIRVTQPSTGAVYVFTSGPECQDFTGCSTTNLQWRLKHDDAGKKIYSDGFTYQYYIDWYDKHFI